MVNDHPRGREGIIGTGERVWRDNDGNPTINKTQRAYQNAVGELVPAGTIDAKPTPAFGWKVDLTNPNGTPWLNEKGLPGWSTYRNDRDTKSVFAGREFPTDFPKVAPTFRHIKGLGVPTLEQYGSQLLTGIVHEYEKFMREHGKSQKTTWGDENLSVSIFQEDLPGFNMGLHIKKGDQYYKIMLTQKYPRKDGRGAWSVYIKKESFPNSGAYQNYKLAPVGDSHFIARTVKDQKAFSPELALDETNIALLEEVYKLFQ